MFHVKHLKKVYDRLLVNGKNYQSFVSKNFSLLIKVGEIIKFAKGLGNYENQKSIGI